MLMIPSAVGGCKEKRGEGVKVEPEYLDLLNEELADAMDRMKRADPEGLPVVNRQIREIQRDIRRYSKKIRDFRKMETPGDTGNHPETPGERFFA